MSELTDGSVIASEQSFLLPKKQLFSPQQENESYTEQIDESDLKIKQPTENLAVVISESANENNTRLWEELDRPWPSTFDRSISILASPLINAMEVELFTKSPKPGSTPLALARRRNLDRGFYTPNVADALSGLRSGNRRGDEEDDQGDSFRLGIAKIQSLDFWKSNAVPNIENVKTIQQQKTEKAKEYRKLILKKAQNSPGTASLKSNNSKSERPSNQVKVDSNASPKTVTATTFAQCVFNLANILMGMGLLGLPFAFKAAGWIGGGLSLLFFGILTWRTAVLIGRTLNGDPRPCSYFQESPYLSPMIPGSNAKARMYPPISSFPDIARASFGQTGCIIISVLLYFELFSCVCIFLVSIGDHLHELFPSITSTTHIAVATSISLVPTVLLRTPALLSYFSMMGTVATITVVLVVIGTAIANGDISEVVAEKEGFTVDEEYHTQWRPEGLVLSLGIVSYCFSGHAIVPSIYSSMKKPQDFEKMATFTFAVVVASCFAVAVSGYFMFGATVQDQVTLSLKQNCSAVKLMNALTSLMVLTGTLLLKYSSYNLFHC